MYARIAYVTYSGDLPDTDLPPALAAMRRARLAPEAVAWDAPADWEDFDLVVVRSAWDYSARRQEFLRWARVVEEQTLLANPARILARNTDPNRLRDLARAGLATVDTVWFEPGDDPAACQQALVARGWTRFCVRPSVGPPARTVAGSPGEAASRAAALAGLGHLAMIQPADQEATLSVIVLGGATSHAVRREHSGGVLPAEIPDDVDELLPEILAVGSDGESLLYARVDLTPQAGRWLLRDFEATEPRLFLDSDPAAADRFARAVRTAVSPLAEV
jgi:hypothetical protein